MNDFLKKYILAYFKDGMASYSFLAMARHLGVSVDRISDIIDTLIEDDALEYNDENLLTITPTGRLLILNQREDYLSFEEQPSHSQIINLEMAWPKEKIYLPKNFLSKL